MRRSADESIPFLDSIGVRSQQYRAPGIHGANNAHVYAAVIVPTANRLFARMAR